MDRTDDTNLPEVDETYEDDPRIRHGNPKLSKALWGFLLLIAIVLLPYWSWYIWPQPRKFTAVILDKTVADATYREHKGLIWILNHDRYVTSDGSEYAEDKDYYGFYPGPNDPDPNRPGSLHNPDRPQYKVRPLPTPLKSPDLIYLADTYGVYTDDYYGPGIKTGVHSKTLPPPVTNGLMGDEVKNIEGALRTGSTLVAEYNTLASPTDGGVADAIGKVLGVHWSGWSGRWFDDLSKNTAPPPGYNAQIPEWAPRLYFQQYHRNWDFVGEGFLLISKAGEIIVLSKETGDYSEDPLKFSLTSKGRSYFGFDASLHYNYWFDIVQAAPNADVLANYSWTLKPSGVALLQAKNIYLPFFPAVVHRRGPNYNTYYFAGDYCDRSEVPSFYKIKGMVSWKKWFASEGQSSQTRFYWKVYVRMMNWILTDIRNQRGSSTGAPEPPTYFVGPGAGNSPRSAPGGEKGPGSGRTTKVAIRE